MEYSSFSLDQYNDNKKKLGELFEKNKKISENLRDTRVQTSLLNIDSINRNVNPKNITENNNVTLNNDPITTTLGDNNVKIYYPNHSFNPGDLITINNVKGYDKTLSSSISLINNLEYLILYIPNHGIPINYKDYVEEIKVDINLVSTTENSFYKTIPINMILGMHKILIFNEFKAFFNDTDVTYQNLLSKLDFNKETDYLFVKLDFIFFDTTDNLFKIDDIYKVKFQDLNGIPLNNINSDYPINFDRSQGHQEITVTEPNYIYFQANNKAYKSGSSGGNNVIISKVIKSIAGFPNAGEFSLQLRKNFTNIVRVEIISSEFPFSDYMVRDKVNNKLYWQHLDDGDNVYSISIPSGNYNSTNLISTIKDEMNKVTRFNSTPENRIFNIFEIEIDTFTNKIKFSAFSDTLLPNSITESTVVLNNKQYTKLDIKHPNNFVEIDDEITISNCEAISIIPKAAINKTHIVYSVNKTDNTYAVLLEPFTALTASLNDVVTRGGPSVRIKSAAKVRFLFNYKDTLGNLLNFRNPGDEYSITNFKSIITNFDNYIYSSSLDSVGNKRSDTNFLQLTGSTNYWLLYVNNIESVILSSGLPNCFAKILLAGTQGDVIFNSFVNNPVEFEVPLSTLSEINVKVTDSQGNIVDFENTNFSFTLKIYELVVTPKNTGKLSQDTSYIKELIENNQKSNL